MVRFGDKNWTDHLKKAAQDFKFNATLKPRLDVEIDNWHDSQPSPEPRSVLAEDDKPGATPLAGAMSIRYDWLDERDTDPTA